ncbi:MAG: hypothetical protein E2O40_03735 [Planctomycetota bacterium]|nr:MAG: hypothetical protein E2O40_03735 [Planctomycetota bacterium]
MPDLIAPLETLTFTVAKVPRRPAQVKTIERLMKLEPERQRLLRHLQRRRMVSDNVVSIRAGRKWINRVRATKVARAHLGETFTITVTPQVIPDLRSVEKFLKVEKVR